MVSMSKFRAVYCWLGLEYADCIPYRGVRPLTYIHKDYPGYDAKLYPVVWLGF